MLIPYLTQKSVCVTGLNERLFVATAVSKPLDVFIIYAPSILGRVFCSIGHNVLIAEAIVSANIDNPKFHRSIFNRPKEKCSLKLLLFMMQLKLIISWYLVIIISNHNQREKEIPKNNTCERKDHIL